MKRAFGKWIWAQLDRRDSANISVMLTRKDHSIAIILPRPPGWGGNSVEDRELIRSILFEAAEEPWSQPQERS